VRSRTSPVISPGAREVDVLDSILLGERIQKYMEELLSGKRLSVYVLHEFLLVVLK